MPLHRRVSLVAVIAGLLVVGACGSSSHPDNPQKVATHSVERGRQGSGSGDHVTSMTVSPPSHPRSTSSTVPVLTRVLEVTELVTAYLKALPPAAVQVIPPRIQPGPSPIQTGTGTAGSVNGFACGNALPPCYVLRRESRGNPFAVEPVHRGAPFGDPGDPWHHASGLWEFMPGTWNNYAGYPYAAAAPPDVQNAKAREVWAGGAGCSHWSAC